ncbi:hypothetical protein U0868_06865 [Kluyvera ascorbata]|uniref:hypothetical protein n=1 Tax=Kluyvera ascorbata TaxID=51288 RepID=UPI002AB7FA74|nr:hypothetical protein [Kluyvera ascorbata]MDZ4031272.1 hypothetical protein [Kluyvera ascorbata]
MKDDLKLISMLTLTLLAGCGNEQPPTADQLKRGLEHLYISSKTSPDNQYEYGVTEIISVDLLGNGCEKQRDSIDWSCDIAINYINYKGKTVKRLTKMSFYYHEGKVVPSILDGMQIFNPEDVQDKNTAE